MMSKRYAAAQFKKIRFYMIDNGLHPKSETRV